VTSGSMPEVGKVTFRFIEKVVYCLVVGRNSAPLLDATQSVVVWMCHRSLPLDIAAKV
jgi:hypothetical protein